MERSEIREKIQKQGFRKRRPPSNNQKEKAKTERNVGWKSSKSKGEKGHLKKGLRGVRLYRRGVRKQGTEGGKQ